MNWDQVATLIAAPYAEELWRCATTRKRVADSAEGGKRHAQAQRPRRRGDPAQALRPRFQLPRADAAVIKDPRTLARIRALVIPPAWEDVWICADPRGHIQAIGTDAAGRRQYRYHDLWREQRDQDKHDRVREFGAALPRIREVICRHLEGQGLTRDRVLRPRFA